MKKRFLISLLILSACGSESDQYYPELPIAINELTGWEAEIIDEMNTYFGEELFIIDNDNPDFEISYGDLEDSTRGRIKYDEGVIIMDEGEVGGNGLRYKRVLFHELGHALGAHHSDDEKSIMFHSAPMAGGTKSFEGYLTEIVDGLIEDQKNIYE